MLNQRADFVDRGDQVAMRPRGQRGGVAQGTTKRFELSSDLAPVFRTP